MSAYKQFNAALLASVAMVFLAAPSSAEDFNIPSGTLSAALDNYAAATGVDLVVSAQALKGIRTGGVSGSMSRDEALSRLLSGTGFVAQREDEAVAIVRPSSPRSELVPANVSPIQIAQAGTVARASVETVTVTSSKLGGADVQSIPIAITALSQEQLTATQTAGGPDLVKQVPNLTFSKTNFTGYNVQIRGIGTQAISVTTDPAVAVSFNDIPFIRNHFFEQEFFDVSQLEVLRGPQGTLYGRNATSGVVNMISAKPTDRWEAQVSVDVGNYENRRLEGMLNIPILDDKLDLRAAGEWTKRDGYSFNEGTQKQIDGRDLWSGRVSLLVHPIQNLTATVVYEHFQEDDDRARSSKQLCARSDAPAVVDGPAGPQVPNNRNYLTPDGNLGQPWLSQGCKAASLYSPQSYQTPDIGGAPFMAPFVVFAGLNGYLSGDKWTDPYAGVTQAPDLRVISSQIDPVYRAKNNTVEFNVDYNVTSDLTLTSQTAYSDDFLYSTEDYNRFNTVDNFLQDRQPIADPNFPGTYVGQDHQFCDPQLGCSSRFLAEDRSSESSRQVYQEVRLSSNFEGPLNFVVGGNYLNYRTVEDYYVFSNQFTLIAMTVGNNVFVGGTPGVDAPHIPFDPVGANSCNPQPASLDRIGAPLFGGIGCEYIDPNPVDKVNGQGHNYFLSHNPYGLKSWAAFGEAYYQVMPDVKLTGGLRFTDDSKDFPIFPSWTLVEGKGLLQQGEIDQEWQEVTGRAVVNWTPKLDFTDQTLIYASFAHGYKGGGANPPGVVPLCFGTLCTTSPSNQTHPLTFKPEFNNAFELGTKNGALDGALVVNADVFYYKYKNYQISQIVDRTAVNLNFDATVRGAEIETTWSPLPGLKFGFNGGYENATIDSGQSAIDLMDRTAGHTDWLVVKPFPTQTSNCILPRDVVNLSLARLGNSLTQICLSAYSFGFDSTFDPSTAPNGGQGFAKDVGGNDLPNTPHFNTSFSADYSMPISGDWAGTLHGDFYWQSNSYWRIFNDSDYDKLRGYTSVNLSLILTNQDGWQAMAYVKNVFDTTAITGAFLNSDDSSLTTNVFTTDPRLFGIRITKNW